MGRGARGSAGGGGLVAAGGTRSGSGVLRNDLTDDGALLVRAHQHVRVHEHGGRRRSVSLLLVAARGSALAHAHFVSFRVFISVFFWTSCLPRQKGLFGCSLPETDPLDLPVRGC